MRGTKRIGGSHVRVQGLYGQGIEKVAEKLNKLDQEGWELEAMAQGVGAVLSLVEYSVIVRRPPATPVPSAPFWGATDAANQLRRLDDLRSRNALTESEYAAKRKAILDRL